MDQASAASEVNKLFIIWLAVIFSTCGIVHLSGFQVWLITLQTNLIVNTDKTMFFKNMKVIDVMKSFIIYQDNF